MKRRLKLNRQPLCNHDECCGQYVDSIGLGLTLSCNCVCHHNNEKVEGMDKVTSQPKPQLIGAAIDKKEETLLSDDCF
jgi:hypothetical protein